MRLSTICGVEIIIVKTPTETIPYRAIRTHCHSFLFQSRGRTKTRKRNVTGIRK